MSVYERPVLFAIAAAAVIAAGTLVTTFIPMLLPSTQPTSPSILPYTAIELEGRDVYIREGCNNCHTQTVRPLRAEVARYGEYSKPEESAYDRPFLWGSRRTGTDLARIGGKYPDAWHYRHMTAPRAMFGNSIMPPYGWLAGRRLDTSLSARKAVVLGYGYGDEEVARQIEAVRKTVTAADYPSAKARSEATPEGLRGELTEMDALVAYLQKVGRDLKEVRKREAGGAGEPDAAARNPYAGDRKAEGEGEAIFNANCRSCHGEKGKGGFGPSLDGRGRWKYGRTDGDLLRTLSGGRDGGMPPFEGTLGKDRIWKVISYLRILGKP
jgi:cytochrome c oxidase cbb3-type subunit 2